MKSLANTEKFPAGNYVEVNREMFVFDTIDSENRQKVFVSCWNGEHFRGVSKVEDMWALTVHYHACEVETDENTFVRDGVRYVAVEGTGCKNCHLKSTECTELPCHNTERKDRRDVNWKRADTQTRPMTAREIYELAHKGAAFGCVSNRNTIHVTTKENVVSNIHREHFVYCLPCDMTDDEPKNWKWRKLEKMGNGNTYEILCMLERINESIELLKRTQSEIMEKLNEVQQCQEKRGEK